MTTNFFEHLASLQVEGELCITVKPLPPDTMVVSVLLRNDRIGDNARLVIPPFTTNGTAKELDEGFFNQITNPLRQTAALFSNMEHYAKSQEAARLASKMEKDKQQAAKKEQEEAKKKYEAAMKKVAELESAGKYREAHGQLPKPGEFPQQDDAINQKRQELARKFEQQSLF